MLFLGDISLNTISSRWWIGLSGKQLSLWTTPMASQSKRESAGGDGGLKMSGSNGRCFWKRRSEKSFGFWVRGRWDPGTLHVSGTGSEAANRILNSWSKESTTGPRRTVTSCRCRWASVHVRLQRTKTWLELILKEVKNEIMLVYL